MSWLTFFSGIWHALDTRIIPSQIRSFIYYGRLQHKRAHGPWRPGSQMRHTFRTEKNVNKTPQWDQN
jgi:hypothetical protein